MSISKRAVVCLVRNPQRSVILFTIIFLLAVSMAVALSIAQGIVNTDNNLRRSLPPLVSLAFNQDAFNQKLYENEAGVYIEPISPAIIREIGELPYVRLFDYAVYSESFYSHELVRVFKADLLVGDIDHCSLPAQGIIGLEWFSIKGVENPLVVDLESGLINLVAGRTFTEDEVRQGASVVIISKDFSEVNQLFLGERLVLYHKIFNEPDAGTFVPEEHYIESNLLLSTRFELDIVGIFDHTLSEDVSAGDWEVDNHHRIVNRIYVPNCIIESTIYLYLEAFPHVEEIIGGVDERDVVFDYQDIIFLLYDPMDLEYFRAEATTILPEMWMINDLSNAYADISGSMKTMRMIAARIMVGSIIATAVTLGLLVLIFLRDRKTEIGIYLALGEKRIRVMGQIVTELLIISIIAVTLALMVGNTIADGISETMIKSSLYHQANEERELKLETGSLELMGFVHEMSNEQMIDSYNVSLNASSIALFYIIVLSSILLAISLSLIYVMHLKPKEILLK